MNRINLKIFNKNKLTNKKKTQTKIKVKNNDS